MYLVPKYVKKIPVLQEIRIQLTLVSNMLSDTFLKPNLDKYINVFLSRR